MLFALFLALAPACEGEVGGGVDRERAPAPAGPAGGAEGARAGASDAARAGAGRSGFAGHMPEKPAWGRAIEAQVRASADDWPLEDFALRAEDTLRALLDDALHGRVDAARARTAAGFRGTGALLVAADELVRDDGFLAVRRAGAGAEHAPVDLEGLCARAGQGGWLAGAAPPRVELAIDRVEEDPSGELRARVQLRLLDEEGARRRQTNATWESRWEPGPRGAGGLLALHGERHEEVALAGALFDELTEHVFGALPFYERELSLGNDAYLMRTDRLLDPIFDGLLGMTVGDVDGDGLEDVYLSQGAPHPNRLLLHRADGTVEDASARAGVDFLDASRGALFFDADGDGALDLAVAVDASVVLCYGDGEGRFPKRQVLEGAPGTVVHSLCAGDYDGDEDLDLFACVQPTSAIHAVPTPYHEAENGAPNRLWRNEGERAWLEVADEVGLNDGLPRFTFVAIWEDFDDDGDLDLYGVNDYGSNNLWLNEGGRFHDAAAQLGARNLAAGMGISICDVDLDGDRDMYVSNMHGPIATRTVRSPQFMPGRGPEFDAYYDMQSKGNALLMGTREGGFEDGSDEAAIGPGGWTWGAIFGDLDNDGLAEIYVPNGFITGPAEGDLVSLFWRVLINSSPADATQSEAYQHAWATTGHLVLYEGASWNGRERNYCYWNLGGGRFADASAASGADLLDDGRVAVAIDWDSDGRLDLLLRNRTGPRLRLLRNVHPASGGWVAFELAGRAPNTRAVGARVRVAAGEWSQERTLYAGEGLLGQSSARLHFGLGSHEGGVDVRVRWPDGAVTTHERLAPGRTWRLAREGGAPTELVPPPPLDEAPARSLPTRLGRAQRVVLASKLPIDALRFPARGGRRSVGELAGPGASAALLVLHDPAREEDRAQLEALGAAREELAKSGLALVPLVLPDARGAGGGVAHLADTGLGAGAAELGKQDERVLLALLMEVLGPFEELPLPVALLVDSSSSVLCLYFGPLDLRELAADARRARYVDPQSGSTRALTGGFWIREPHRDYRQLAGILQRLGARELARGYFQR